MKGKYMLLPLFVIVLGISCLVVTPGAGSVIREYHEETFETKNNVVPDLSELSLASGAKVQHFDGLKRLINTARQDNHTEEEDHDHDHEEHEDVSCDSTCVGWKIGFLFINLAENLGLAVLVRYAGKIFSKCGNFSWMTVYLETFAGGILLAVSLLELLNHATEELATVTEEQFSGYPYATTMFGIGFLLILGVEAMLGPFILNKLVLREKNLAVERNESAGAAVEHDHTEGSTGEDVHEGHDHGIAQLIAVSYPSKPAKAEKTVENGDEEESESSASDSKLALSADEEESKKMFIRATFLFGAAITTIAVSIHSFFEGIALGIGNLDQAILVFIGDMSHEWADMYAICIQLMRAEVSTLTYFSFALFFSIFGPIGIGIGIAISQEVNVIATGTLNAIAAGCLVYAATVGAIGVRQILNVNQAWKRRWGLFGMYIAGFATITVIVVILVFTGVKEGHSHAH